MKSRWIGLVVGIVFLSSPQMFAETLPTAVMGANVDESGVTKILYVDPAHTEAADDDKHGAADAPFATFSYACRAAVRAKDANVGVKIVLANGSYRETAEIFAPPTGTADTEAPLVIEAAERDQAVVDGADTLGWTPSTWKAENGRWTHPWPFTRPKVPKVRPDPWLGAPARSGDLIFINGLPVRQVGAEADLAPGTFWGSVSHNPAVRGAAPFNFNVAVLPPEDTELESAIVQVGIRPRGLTVVGRRNVVVRGVMFQHAADPTGHSAAETEVAGLRLEGCANVLIEDVLCQWNDGAGLRVDGDSSGVTLRRVRLLHNGLSGLTVAAKNVLAEDCEASFNDFRGEWSGHAAADAAAVSVNGSRDTAFRRLRAVGNFAVGMAVRESGNLTVEDSVLRNNLNAGIIVRSGGGLTTIRHSVVAGTRRGLPIGKEILEMGGVVLGQTPSVTLESNVLAGNAGTQLLLWEPAEGMPSGGAGHHVYRHNVFSGTDADELLWTLPDGPKVKGMPQEYFRELETDDNCFWNPALADAFAAVGPVGQRLGEGLTLERWREFLSARANSLAAADARSKGPETHSLWQDPLFVDPAEGDFRLKKGSPVADWDLPSDEAAEGQ